MIPSHSLNCLQDKRLVCLPSPWLWKTKLQDLIFLIIFFHSVDIDRAIQIHLLSKVI